MAWLTEECEGSWDGGASAKGRSFVPEACSLVNRVLSHLNKNVSISSGAPIP